MAAANSGEQEFPVYKGKQYFTLFTVFLAIFVNSTSILTFNYHNATCTELVYSVEGTAVGQIFLVVSLLIYPIMTYATNSMAYFSKGARAGPSLGAALSLAGAFCRGGSVWWAPGGGGYARYNLLLAGQVLFACAQPLLLNPVLQITDDWFDAMERDWSSKALLSAAPAGTVAGLLAGARLVVARGGGGGAEGGPACRGEAGFSRLFAAQAAAAGAALLLLCAGPARPPAAPSRAALRAWREAERRCRDWGRDRAGRARRQARRDLRALLKTGNFVWLLLSFACTYGLANGLIYAITETSLLVNQGYTLDQLLTFTLSMLIGGLIGIYFSGLSVTLVMYHPTRKLGSLILVGAAILFNTWVRSSEDTSSPGLAFLVFGMGAMPLFPVTMETAIELSHPTPEPLAAGAVLSAGHLGALLVYAAAGRLRAGPLPLPAGIIPGDLSPSLAAFAWYKVFLLLVAVAGALFSLSSYGLYQRVKADKPSSSNRGASGHQQAFLSEHQQQHRQQRRRKRSTSSRWSHEEEERRLNVSPFRLPLVSGL